MDFGAAITALKNGQRVRRSLWEGQSFVFYKPGEKNPLRMFMDDNLSNIVFMPTPLELFAEDWMVYGE